MRTKRIPFIVDIAFLLGATAVILGSFEISFFF